MRLCFAIDYFSGQRAFEVAKPIWRVHVLYVIRELKLWV